LVFARCAAQRLRCASAIFLRASALSTRLFLGLALAAALPALGPAVVEAVPMLASSLRACVSLAISESNWARMFSIAIWKRITQESGFGKELSTGISRLIRIVSFVVAVGAALLLDSIGMPYAAEAFMRPLVFSLIEGSKDQAQRIRGQPYSLSPFAVRTIYCLRA
jgi:hypothetical protein